MWCTSTVACVKFKEPYDTRSILAPIPRRPQGGRKTACPPRSLPPRIYLYCRAFTVLLLIPGRRLMKAQLDTCVYIYILGRYVLEGPSSG